MAHGNEGSSLGQTPTAGHEEARAEFLVHDRADAGFPIVGGRMSRDGMG